MATFFPLGHVQTPPSRELLQSCSQLSEVHNVVAEIKMVKLQLPLEAQFFQIIAPMGYYSIIHAPTYTYNDKKTRTTAAVMFKLDYIKCTIESTEIEFMKTYLILWCHKTI